MQLSKIRNLDLRPAADKAVPGKSAKASTTSHPYEGARTGRRMGYWGLSSTGPNNSIFGSLDNLRHRSRELVRNDPQIDGGQDILVADLVGKGITPGGRSTTRASRTASRNSGTTGSPNPTTTKT